VSAIRINSVCVCHIPDALVAAFSEGGDFPQAALRYFARIDGELLEATRVEILPAVDEEGIEGWFNGHAMLCRYALWIHFPDDISYEHLDSLRTTAQAFCRGWMLGRLSVGVAV
jgi:hypothetical protein